MSAIYFCDVCKLQMADDDHGRVKRKLGNLEIEVMHCLGSWNSGHVCHSCVVEAVQKGATVSRPHLSTPEK